MTERAFKFTFSRERVFVGKNKPLVCISNLAQKEKNNEDRQCSSG